MCAEKLPAQCHRSLIADYLVLKGVNVVHLIEAEDTREHLLNPHARTESGKLVYDPAGLAVAAAGVREKWHKDVGCRAEDAKKIRRRQAGARQLMPARSTDAGSTTSIMIGRWSGYGVVQHADVFHLQRR